MKSCVRCSFPSVLTFPRILYYISFDVKEEKGEEKDSEMDTSGVRTSSNPREAYSLRIKSNNLL